jgi:hypothetical protein
MLRVAVTGIEHGDYAYDMYFQLREAVTPAEAVLGALLRWLEPGRGAPIRPGTYQITRASSANGSARRAVGRTSVPRS